jgi:outer membrane protein
MRSLCWLGRTALLVLFVPLSAGQETPPASADSDRVLQLSLEDVLRIALQNNVDVEIERLNTERAEYEALGSWGAFDPIVSATGTASRNERQGTSSLAGGDVVTDDDLVLNAGVSVPIRTGGRFDLSLDHTNAKTNNQFAAFDVSTTDVITVALTQPLLRGAWSRYATATQRERGIALERQRQREREIEAGMLLDAYNAYWDLVSSLEELRVREVAVELGRQQLAQDQRRLEVGAGTEVDVLQAETNVAQREEQRLQAEFARRQARDDLRHVLSPRPDGDYTDFLDAWDWGIEPLTPLPAVARADDPEWRDSLRQAIDARPELEQLRLDIRTAETELARTASERLPQLDLDLSSRSVGFDNEPRDAFNTAASWDFPSSSAALTLSLPLGNRTARGAYRAARASLRAAMLAYDKAELDVLAGVRAAVRDVVYRRESAIAAAKSLDLARRQLEAEQTRQEVGLSTTFQVLQFQEDMAQALSAEVAARAAYAKALAALAHAEGRLNVDLAGADPRK